MFLEEEKILSDIYPGQYRRVERLKRKKRRVQSSRRRETPSWKKKHNV